MAKKAVRKRKTVDGDGNNVASMTNDVSGDSSIQNANSASASNSDSASSKFDDLSDLDGLPMNSNANDDDDDNNPFGSARPITPAPAPAPAPAPVPAPAPARSVESDFFGEIPAIITPPASTARPGDAPAPGSAPGPVPGASRQSSANTPSPLAGHRWRRGRPRPVDHVSPGRQTEKKFVKATREEIEERVDLVAKLLARRAKKSEIKKLIKKKFSPDPDNPLSTRQIEIYIARAKALNLKMTSRTADEHRADLAMILDGAIADVEATPRDRIAAVDTYMRLLGIDQLPPQAQVNFNVNTSTPILEIEVGSREDLDEILDNPEIARLAYTGKLPGIPRDKAEASLKKHGLIVDGKVVEKVVDNVVKSDIPEEPEISDDELEIDDDMDGMEELDQKYAGDNDGDNDGESDDDQKGDSQQSNAADEAIDLIVDDLSIGDID